MTFLDFVGGPTLSKPFLLLPEADLGILSEEGGLTNTKWVKTFEIYIF